MNVVYLIQAGDTDAVTLGVVEHRFLERRIRRLQEGNHVVLQVRALLDGDERLEAQLRERWHDQALRGRWYRAAVLGDIPESVQRIDDEDAEDQVRRVVIADLDDLLEGGR